MRMTFGLLGLVLTLFVVVQLVRTQTAATAPVPVDAAEMAPPDAGLPAPQANPKQVPEQYQRALDDALKAGQQRLVATEKP
jgi:hypothetical protein